MLRQFDNFSTWRQDTITIQPHEVATINFKDTTPNIFVIQNSNTAMLKVGISNIPRDNSYEFKVDYNTTETVGRPFGSNNLYILNDSSIEVKISVFSIQKEFDPTILKNMNVSLNGYTIESSSEISSVAKGVILPTEDKNSSEAISMLRTIAQNSGLMSLLNDIAQNTANLELNAENVTVTNEYDDTNLMSYIDLLLTIMKGFTGCTDDGSLKNTVYSVLNNIGTAVNSLKGSHLTPAGKNMSHLFEEIQTLNTKTDTLSEKLRDIEKSILFKGYAIKFPTYKNNVVEYSYTPKGAVGLNFDYIYNDSDSPITVYIEQVDIQGSATVTNKQEVFTIMPKEKVENIEFLTLDETMTITIEGIQPIFRLKQTIYTDSLFNV